MFQIQTLYISLYTRSHVNIQLSMFFLDLIPFLHCSLQTIYPKLSKRQLTKKQNDGELDHMIWAPQSLDLHLVEMIWNFELDYGVKVKQI